MLDPNDKYSLDVTDNQLRVDDDRLNPREIFSYASGLVSRRWHYLVFGLFGAVSIACGALTVLTPRYISTAELLLVDPATENLGSGNHSLTIAPDLASVASDMSLLRSQSLALRVVRELHLASDPEFTAGAGTKGIAAAADMDETLAAVANELRKHIQVERSSSSYVLDVSVSSRDPRKAQQLSNTLVKAFLDNERQVRKDAVEQVQGWWTDRLDFPDVGGRVITAATLPEVPIFPKWKGIILVAAILGAAAGSTLAVLRELLDDRTRTRGATGKIVGSPVIGMIPIIEDGVEGIDHRVLLSSLTDAPSSHLSEEVKAILSFLRLKGFGNQKKVLLATSALAGEGKSTIAMLLAAGSALLGEKSVLIDCDLRHRSISSQFARTRKGWNDMLAGLADLGDVAVKEDGTGLHIIVAGRSVDPTRALLGRSTRDLLTRLRAEYDLVVIDAGPILGTVDAAILGALADEIVLIVEWGSTTNANIMDALKIMKMTEHQVGCVIMNKVNYQTLWRYDSSYTTYVYGSRSGVVEACYDGW